MIGAIYIHVNKNDGKCYVGQSKNPAKRWRSKSSAYLNNPHLHRALQRDGWDGFDHQVVFQQECTQEELNSLEQIWIMMLNSRDSRFGYNFRAGGHRGDFSNATRERMSAAAKNRIGELNNFFGKTHSEETRQTIRDWHCANGSRLWTPERRAAQAERVRKLRVERQWSSGRKRLSKA